MPAMLDHDDPMLCPDRHSEVEIAHRLAEIKGGIRAARGLRIAEIPDIVGVLDPHAGTGHLMVERELLVDLVDALCSHPEARRHAALLERAAGALS